MKLGLMWAGFVLYLTPRKRRSCVELMKTEMVLFNLVLGVLRKKNARADAHFMPEYAGEGTASVLNFFPNPLRSFGLFLLPTP